MNMWAFWKASFFLNRLRSVPADDHRCYDWFPACSEQQAAGWVFGGDDHPNRNQAQKQQIHQVQHIGIHVCEEENLLFIH